MPKSKTTNQQILEHLKKQFEYDHKGVPDIYSYGIFKDGLTSDEVQNYLRVRVNSYNIPQDILNRYSDSNRGDTCQAVEVDGKTVTLFYRHDVLRHADKAIDNKPTYFD